MRANLASIMPQAIGAWCARDGHDVGVAYYSGPQPLDAVPGVQERWPFLAPLMERAPLVKFVPMLSSLGCPYRCGFCVDATQAYRPLDVREIVEDLRFLRRMLRRPHVGWHDPNFGIRFDDIMSAIEEAVPPGSIDFVAESTLSVLTEPNLARMRRNGFKPHPVPGRLSGLLAADRVRPQRPAERRLSSRRAHHRRPVSLPEQLPRHERAAETLRMAPVLRSHDRAVRALLLAGRHRQTAACERAGGRVDQFAARAFFRGRRPHGVLPGIPPGARSAEFRRYFERGSDVVPPELASPVRRDLGSLWQWLPPGALRPSQADFDPG